MGKSSGYISKIVGCGGMKGIKVSLICTVKNEEFSIREFLDSLLSQSRPPDEIVLTDGGSTDRTVEIIDEYIKNGAPIKLIVAQGNRSVGRNVAIKNTNSDYIACTDAGVILDKDWLKNLVEPFQANPNIDVVAGWYVLDAETEFEECLAASTAPDIKRVDPNTFLPSARSIAFKKEAWKRVGGFPEQFSWNEDTPFDISLKKAGFRFALAPNAIARWRVSPNLRSVFKQNYLYARGDGEARLLRKYPFYFVFYIGSIVLFAASFWYSLAWGILLASWTAYFVRAIRKAFKSKKSWRVVFKVPIIKITIDLALIAGFFRGYLFSKQLLARLSELLGFEVRGEK